jgi:hypothetical protein
MIDHLPSKKCDEAFVKLVGILQTSAYSAGASGGNVGLDTMGKSGQAIIDCYADLEHKFDTCGLQCSATMKSLLAEVEQLRTALTGISTCSTCEACRGAALRALGGEVPAARKPDKFDLAFEIMRQLDAEDMETMQSCQFGYVMRVTRERTVAEINAAVDERLDRVERELARPTTAAVHAMCKYLREECSQCPSREDTIYGPGVRGCYSVAEETILTAQRFTQPPGAG